MALGLLTLIVGVAAGPARAASLVPHRALYQMELSRVESASGVVGADGEMYFEVIERCDGWSVNQHAELRLSLDGENTSVIRLLFSGWEAHDGRRMRFQLERKTDGAILEEVVGEAELDDTGGVAHFTKPAVARLALPAGTLFPIAYLRNGLKSLAAGDALYSAALFDGSTADGAYEVTSFFGPAELRERLGDDRDDGAREQVWPIRSAYFMYGQNHEEPLFEVGELVNAAGVAHRLDLDHGAFSVRAEITQFEAFGTPDC